MNEDKIMGMIFNIQRYAIHDGPGIRTLVFMKGCPLRCKWCQNPESWKINENIIFFKEKCIDCKSCLNSCEYNAIQFEESGRINRERCVVPKCSLGCVGVCEAEAIQLIGEKMTITDILDTVKKDNKYYINSGGGVTISGGEPFYQPEFLQALLKKCKEEEGIHTVVETCGYVKWEFLEEILPYIDLFYYDIKILNRNEHKKYTGKQNDLILSNLKRIKISGAPIIIRVPIIPTVNDFSEFISELARFVKDLSILEVHLLPYHRLAEKKYERLELKYKLENIAPLEDKKLEDFKKILESEGITVKIRG